MLLSAVFFFIVPPCGEVVGPGIFYKLLFISPITPEKEGNAVMDFREDQWDSSSPDTNSSLAAEAITDDDPTTEWIFAGLINCSF
jgi:hypothetical protein